MSEIDFLKLILKLLGGIKPEFWYGARFNHLKGLIEGRIITLADEKK